MRHIFTAAALATLAATTGCTAVPGLGALIGAATFDANAAKVAVTGKVTVSKDQTAMVAAGGGNIVAAGGLNLRILALPGEGAAAKLKLKIANYPGGSYTVPVETDSAGSFKVEIPGNSVYSAKTDAGTLPHVIVSGAAATSVTLDGANRLVAAKLFSTGKTADGAKINDAIAKLRSSLTASPTAGDESGLAAEFDAKASAEVKALLGL